MNKLVLVDGSGYIFRAYYALPFMKRSDGTPVNAVFGFTNMLLKLLEDIQQENGGKIAVAVVFDAARETFRNKIYKDYKANRKDAPDDLIPQFEIIKRIPNILNLPAIESYGYEADDLIATYCKSALQNNLKVTIVTSDKDFMQLMKKNVTILDPIKKKELSESDVLEKFGVSPEKVIDVQALAGDASDNIPGVPGIGVKTAALLINEYSSLENLLNKAQNIKQEKRRLSILNNSELAILSKKLVILKDDIELPINIEKLFFKPLEIKKLISFLDEMEFVKIKSQIISKYGKNNLGESKTETKELDNLSIENSNQNINYKNYKLIQEIDELEIWLRKVEEFGVCSIDCETDSLSPTEAKLVGFAISLENSEACYIPLQHKGDLNKKFNQIKIKDFVEKIKVILNDKSILKIGQNIKYDLIILKNLGIDAENVDDTMLMSYVLNSGKHGHGLDELSEKYFDHKTIKYSEITKIEKGRITFDYVDINKALIYSAEDADLTFRLWKKLKNELITNSLYNFYFYIEKPLVQIIMQMEIFGFKVNFESLKNLSFIFEKKIKNIEKKIFDISKVEFNIGSPKQLGQVLFDKLNLPFGKKGKNGNFQTDVSILEKLKNQKFKIAEEVLLWRQYNKLKTTYCDGLILRKNNVTNRVHTSYGMASTITGRLSSNDPNLQNIPIKTIEGKQIRSTFISKNGTKIVSIDYSQIELRILAHVANIKTLKNCFVNNDDIHQMTAMEVFQVNKDEMTDELRRKAKTINFGIIYGISPYGLANQLDISNSEAKDYIDKYFSQYPGIKEYMSSTISECRENGFVKTPFGRQIHIPFINDRQAGRRNFGERSAINAPIQGGAADMIKRAMIKVYEYIKTKKLKTKMLLQVHDELIFEMPFEELKNVPYEIAKIMEIAHEPMIELKVPMKADIGIGENWSEAH